MRWFDDLWLKDGIANYMACRAMESVTWAAPARSLELRR